MVEKSRDWNVYRYETEKPARLVRLPNGSKFLANRRVLVARGMTYDAAMRIIPRNPGDFYHITQD